MKVNVDNVPKGLILFDNWCLWKPEKKDGRLTKVPYTFKDNKLIKCDVTNQSNGMAFFDTVEIAENHNCGIGFMFTENGICGVDVDRTKDHPSMAIYFFSGTCSFSSLFGI